MGQGTKIEWATHTFNPWIGCQKVSPGCAHCYAEEMMDRRYGKAKWGPDGTRVRTAAANWRQPLKWDNAARGAETRPRVFCASLADVFEDRPELAPWRADLTHLIRQCRHMDWLLLTKRPENVARLTAGATGWDAAHWFAANPHVWVGTSVEDQPRADARILELLRCPVATRFLSMEPLLGPVKLPLYIDTGEDMPAWERREWGLPATVIQSHGAPPESKISWVIVGGESGHDARPMHPGWVRSLRDQCKAAGAAFFFKQWGEWRPADAVSDERLEIHTAKGSPVGPRSPEAHVWPDGVVSLRVGKKAAGRLLDGVEHSGFPAPREVAHA